MILKLNLGARPLSSLAVLGSRVVWSDHVKEGPFYARKCSLFPMEKQKSCVKEEIIFVSHKDIKGVKYYVLVTDYKIN